MALKNKEMYSIIEAKEKDGSNLSVTLNNNALGLIQSIPATKLVIILINSSSLKENDSWDEIEEHFQNQIKDLSESVFISKIVRDEFSELYFYSSDKINQEDLKKIKSNWNHDSLLIHDTDYKVNEEMKKSNFISSQEISTLLEMPELFELWEENNIDTSKEFPILFSFYSAYKNETEKFKMSLNEMNYQVESKTKRTLIIFKGYETNAEKSQIWDCENLSEAYLSLLFCAKKNKNVHEGMFARE